MKDTAAVFATVSSRLGDAREALAHGLHQFLWGRMPGGTSILSFEIFSENACVAAYPLDAEEGQLGFAYILEKGAWKYGEASPWEPDDDFDDPVFSEHARDLESRIDAALLEWVASVWRELPSTVKRLPARVEIHDSSAVLEL